MVCRVIHIVAPPSRQKVVLHYPTMTSENVTTEKEDHPNTNNNNARVSGTSLLPAPGDCFYGKFPLFFISFPLMPFQLDFFFKAKPTLFCMARFCRSAVSQSNAVTHFRANAAASHWVTHCVDSQRPTRLLVTPLGRFLR